MSAAGGGAQRERVTLTAVRRRVRNAARPKLWRNWLFGRRHIKESAHGLMQNGKVLSTGLEPMTFALSERRATNCATRAVLG